jgi:hypothetical protein
LRGVLQETIQTPRITIPRVLEVPVVETPTVLMEDPTVTPREEELELTSMDGSWKNWRRHLKPVIILTSS